MISAFGAEFGFELADGDGQRFAQRAVGFEFVGVEDLPELFVDKKQHAATAIIARDFKCGFVVSIREFAGRLFFVAADALIGLKLVVRIANRLLFAVSFSFEFVLAFGL